MSQPIPIEIIPSHVHLSQDDWTTLFGEGYAGTIAQPLSQSGQYTYTDQVEIVGRLKRSLWLPILGPVRQVSQVEVTPTEAAVLGLTPPVVGSGDLREAATCTVRGPQGMVSVGVIIPQPHLHLSDTEAERLRVTHRDTVAVDILGERPRHLTDVVVRVHPTYKLRLHVHPDIAREAWLTGVLHARLRDAHLR